MMKALRLLLVLALFAVAAEAKAQNDRPLRTYDDTLDYYYGWMYGEQLVNAGARLNVDICVSAASDAMNQRPIKVSPDKINEILMELDRRGHVAEESGMTGEDGFLAIYDVVTNNAPGKLATWNDSLSYSIGHNIGQFATTSRPEVADKGFISGLHDRLTNSASKLSEEAVLAINLRMRQEHEEMGQRQAMENIEAGTRFMAENGKRKGVVTTQSGLQYEVVKQGKGAKPTASSVVTVHYVGTLIDGKEFDSSRRRGQPTTFELSKVIPGWTEGVQLMSEGAIYKFYIPPQLAYGPRAMGDVITPNSTLIFEVELLKVN